MTLNSTIFIILISCLRVFAELEPSEVDGNIRIPAGTEIEVVGSVSSPTSLAMGEDGSIYVAETHRFGDGLGIDDNRRYLYWLLDDLKSTTTEDRRALYEKWSGRQPMEVYTKNSERIRRMVPGEKGAAISSEIWAGKFNDVLDGTMSGIGVYQGNVYAACIPNVWVMADDDGDGKADGRKSLQDGFGIRVSISGHDMNGFTLAPDGRLYWTIGDRGFNIMTKEGKNLVSLGQGAVLRMEPDGSQIEVVHGGLRNPKEIAFDEFGDAITVDNNADIGDKARIVYVVEGGDSGWNMGHQVLSTFYATIGLNEVPVNRWITEKMWQTRRDEQLAYYLPPIDNYTSGPSGLDYYPGIGVGEEGQFLICDYRGGAANSAILSFAVEREGAGLKMVNPGEFSVGVAAPDVMFGYDGNVYVADFGGGWTSHDGGRVFRITPKEGALQTDTLDLMKSKFWMREVKDLIPYLEHADLRVRTRAHIGLADAGEAGVAELGKLSHSGNKLVVRRHAVWGLWVAARRGKSSAATSHIEVLLSDKDTEIRAQATRAYGEAWKADGAKLYPLLNDSEARVCFFAAQSLARIGGGGAVKPILEMLDKNGGRDIHLRHAGVHALRRCASPVQIMALKDERSDELRLCAVLALRGLKHSGLVAFLNDKIEAVRAEAISAIHDQQLIEQQPALNAVLENDVSSLENNGSSTEWSSMVWQRLIHAAYRVGGEKNAKLLIRLATLEVMPLEHRAEVLRLLGVWGQPSAIDQSTGVYAPLADRPLEPVLALLQENLGEILSQDGPVLDPALSLLAHYNMQVKGGGIVRMEEIVDQDDLKESIRAKAVQAMTRMGGGKIKPQLVKYAKDKQPLVSIAALEGLMGIDPDAALKQLQEIVTHREAVKKRRQLAWGLLGKMDSPEVCLLVVGALETLTSAEADQDCALEIVNIASKSKDATVQAALQKYQMWMNTQPLGKWHVANQGGDARKGKVLFRTHGTAQCMRCHSVEVGHGSGGDAGPHLSDVGLRRDADYLVRGIIEPHADLADGYGATTLVFPNGAFLSGVLEKVTDREIYISSGDQLWSVSKQLKFSQSEPVSSMPTMAEVLNPEEVRDLVAYLSRQKKEGVQHGKNVAKAVAFDPATAPTDAAVLGKIIYKNNCSFCHKDVGEGDVVFPPLAGSEWLNLDPTSLARMQIHGLIGDVMVKGKKYQGAMPSNAKLSDIELAAVLQYVRKEWGGIDEKILPETIAKVRSEKRVKMWTMDEILQQAPIDAVQRVEKARRMRESANAVDE